MRAIVYQLKVVLNFSEPPVWRRIQVPGATSLEYLHDILQATMGWQNQEWYQFIIDDQIYADAEFGISDFRGNSSQTRLNDLVKRPKSTFLYEYDLTDGWEHEITVEKIQPLPAGKPDILPVCLEGENACPPEGSGGIFGYYELLSVLKQPEHPAYQEILESYGQFDPQAFDLKAVNHTLEELFLLDPAQI